MSRRLGAGFGGARVRDGSGEDLTARIRRRRIGRGRERREEEAGSKRVGGERWNGERRALEPMVEGGGERN